MRYASVVIFESLSVDREMRCCFNWIARFYIGLRCGRFAPLCRPRMRVVRILAAFLFIFGGVR